MKNNRKGFTLIELLIVVAIIGIIVAIAIPNLLNAIQRAKQKRTMGDMRSVSTAVEAYAVDYNHYPASAASSQPSVCFAGTATLTSILTHISPTYMKVVPFTDGWDSWFLYGNLPATGQQDYCVQSNGKNGKADGVTGSGATTDLNADIIFCDGQFCQYPEGVQK